MAKEKTLYSYQSEGYRLQLVRIEDCLGSYYQIRKNRERLLKTISLSDAKHSFFASCRQNLFELSLF